MNSSSAVANSMKSLCLMCPHTNYSGEELIRWGESQQDGNCLAPAKYRFAEYHLDEVRRDYERSRKNMARG